MLVQEWPVLVETSPMPRPGAYAYEQHTAVRQ